MRIEPVRRCIALTLVASAMVGSCSGQSGQSQDAQPEPTSASTQSTTSGPSTTIGLALPASEPAPPLPAKSVPVRVAFSSVEDVQVTLTALHQIRYPSVLVQAAKSKVYFECMTRAGIDVPLALRPVPTAFPPEAPLELPGENAFEQQTLEEVRTRAYNPSDALGDGAPVPIDDPLNDWILAMPTDEFERYQVADFGDRSDPLIVETDEGVFTYPSSGCEYEATDAAYSNAANFYRLIAELNTAEIQLFAFAQQNSTYQDAVEAWRSCLSNLGYETSSPEEMPQDETDRDDSDLAMADWTCRQSEEVGEARQAALVEQANAQSGELQPLQAAVGTTLSEAETSSAELTE